MKKFFTFLTMMTAVAATTLFTSCDARFWEDMEDRQEARTLEGTWSGYIDTYFYDRFGVSGDSYRTSMFFERENSYGGWGYEVAGTMCTSTTTCSTTTISRALWTMAALTVVSTSASPTTAVSSGTTGHAASPVVLPTMPRPSAPAASSQNNKSKRATPWGRRLASPSERRQSMRRSKSHI